MEENKKVEPPKEPAPPRKVQTIALSYYARKDIQNAMFEFCRNRESIANFNNEFFAKRPDCFDYPSDILNQVKSGATSFHCSQEIWSNPLDIKTEMTKEQYNEIRTGWDFLIDIDSKYFDYSKIAAQILLKALKHHGVNKFGIKYSGSKGFHILIPFKSFPEEVSGIQTKNMFPEWPRLIAIYLKSIIHEELTKEILKLTKQEDLEEGKSLFEIKCKNCQNSATKKEIGKYVCPNFKCKAQVESMKSNRKEMICPSCNGRMNRVAKEEVYFCEACKTNSKKFPGNFEEKAKTSELIDSVDLVLVSPRHLFRAPYSLHEKTAFSSVVIDEIELESFKPTDADPLKISKIKSYMPEVIPGQAKDLLMQALDYAEKKEIKSPKFDGPSIDLKGLKISQDMYPPIIKKLLKGIPGDGRKRALSILLSFFSSLEFPKEFIEEKINEWNNKNHLPLKEGYIKSQVDWYSRNKRLPPNYDKPIYKEFGNLDPVETGIKNPINYTIKLALKFSRQP